MARQFDSEAAVVSYVEREIAAALPRGWSCLRERRVPLAWQLRPGVSQTAPLEDYRLRVSGDWELFVLEHGNSDAGGLQLRHVLLNAKVIDAGVLAQFPLREAICDVIANCRPNESGWT